MKGRGGEGRGWRECGRREERVCERKRVEGKRVGREGELRS